MDELRGVVQLVRDTVGRVADVVEHEHGRVASQVLHALALVPPLAPPARVVDRASRSTCRAACGAVRGTTELVAELGDRVLRRLPNPEGRRRVIPMRPDAVTRPARLQEASLGLLNGLWGDDLAARGNPLDLGMQLRLGDRYVCPREVAADRVALFVHGSCLTESCWRQEAGDQPAGTPALNFGELLERDLGFTPVFLRYNSGQRISHNGRRLAALLSELRCRQLVLVGYSMGGLVGRSAAVYGARAAQPWIRALTHVACLGSPHRGAPLEQAAHALATALRQFNTPGTQVPARVLTSRSAGLRDLRWGSLLDEEWAGEGLDALFANPRGPARPLEHVAYLYLAASLTQRRDGLHDRIVGDGLVPVPSASGPPGGNREVQRIRGVAHHQLPRHPEVYARLVRWLRSGPTRPRVA